MGGHRRGRRTRGASRTPHAPFADRPVGHSPGCLYASARRRPRGLAQGRHLHPMPRVAPRAADGGLGRAELRDGGLHGARDGARPERRGLDNRAVGLCLPLRHGHRPRQHGRHAGAPCRPLARPRRSRLRGNGQNRQGDRPFVIRRSSFVIARRGTAAPRLARARASWLCLLRREPVRREPRLLPAAGSPARPAGAHRLGRAGDVRHRRAPWTRCAERKTRPPKHHALAPLLSDQSRRLRIGRLDLLGNPAPLQRTRQTPGRRAGRHRLAHHGGLLPHGLPRLRRHRPPRATQPLPDPWNPLLAGRSRPLALP